MSAYILSIRKYSLELGFYSLCISIFFLSFPRSWTLYPLGIFLILGLVAWISDFSSLRLKFIKKISLILPLICYFILYLIGLIYVDQKWFYIEGYFMFILIPLFGFPLLTSEFFSKNHTIFLKSFIYGILFICIFELLRAAWGAVFHVDFPPPPNVELGFPGTRFTSFQLSFMEHPTYFSLKVLFSATLLFIFRTQLKIPRILFLSMFLLLLVFIFLLSSRTGFVITVCLSFFFLYRYLKKFKLHLLTLILAPLIFFGAYKLFIFNSRIKFKTELIMKNYKAGGLKIRDIDPRFTSWFTALEVIKTKPVFGVGLNSKEILVAEYRKQGFNNEANLKLNAHNQFLETQMTFGIAGTLTLFWILFTPLYKMRQMKNSLMIYSFMIIIFTAFLFESLLVRQWGIMFFVLFYCAQVLLKQADEI